MNSVFCCFSWEKSTKCSQNPGLVNEFSVTPRGQLNWTGPIVNSSDFCVAKTCALRPVLDGWPGELWAADQANVQWTMRKLLVQGRKLGHRRPSDAKINLDSRGWKTHILAMLFLLSLQNHFCPERCPLQFLHMIFRGTILRQATNGSWFRISAQQFDKADSKRLVGKDRSWGCATKLEASAPATSKTRKPGQSAHKLNQPRGSSPDS